MKRLLVLLLVVAAIVALLAWVTNQNLISQAAPLPAGPGQIAEQYRMTVPEANAMPRVRILVQNGVA